MALTVAMIGRFLSSRVSKPEPLTRRHLGTLSVLVIPALIVIAFPPVALGSFAVSRRSAAVKGTYVATSSDELSKGDLSLLDIFGLSYRDELGKLAARAGSTSSFTGFVTKDPNDRADEFRLNRFMISCCPGDAVPVQLRVVGAPPGKVEADDWVRITGSIYPVGTEVVVDASGVERVPRPEHPYLTSN
ncbi:MAG: TIGR03943 family protein [Actinomycetota bacterium]|nr:TIGR03943 family protein [Actinomycetota bacterium]